MLPWYLWARNIDTVSPEDRAHDVAENLAGFLVRFASAWLDEAKSYNATKHGLTAIPGAAAFRIASERGDFVQPDEDHSLTHLSYGEWIDGRREWVIATRWVRLHEAVETIVISHYMMRALWSVARCRFGLAATLRSFDIDSSQFSAEMLDRAERSGVHEVAMPCFLEMKPKE